MEILVSAIHKIGKYGWNSQTRILEGSFSLWMVIPYGVLLTFLFEPTLKLLHIFPDYIKFFCLAVCFTSIELGLGWFFKSVFKIEVWNYSEEPDNIYKFTRMGLFWQWLFCALWLASYSSFINYLAPYAPLYFGY
jgi:hypothetical protein